MGCPSIGPPLNAPSAPETRQESWRKSLGARLVILAQAGEEPRTRVGPLALRSTERHPQRVGGLLQRESGEKSEVHKLDSARVLGVQLGERLIEPQQFFVVVVLGDFDLLQV